MKSLFYPSKKRRGRQGLPVPDRKTAKAWSTNLHVDGNRNDPAALDVLEEG